MFTHLLLADEINRAPAKTQAALLEVMQERQVTLEGRALPVPQPFMVLATQNPIEQEGTYPLPEAELDRFMLKLRIDYPAEAEEQTLVRQVTRSARSDMLDVANLRPLLKDKDVLALQRIASDLPIDDQVLDYAVRLARTTRNWPGLALGAGPRASIALVRCGRARRCCAAASSWCRTTSRAVPWRSCAIGSGCLRSWTSRGCRWTRSCNSCSTRYRPRV